MHICQMLKYFIALTLEREKMPFLKEDEIIVFSSLILKFLKPKGVKLLS